MLVSIMNACDRFVGLLRRLEWLGPLLVRLTLGLVFVTTGWGKLHHIDDVTRFFAQLGIPAPHAQAVLVACLEFAGGILLVLGLGTRFAAALLVGVMAVALWTAKLPELHGFVDLAGTIELS